MNRKTLVYLIVGLSLLAHLPAFSATFDTVVAFGDSLTDNGNYYDISPIDILPEVYYQGRVSNGPVWVEYLAGPGLLNSSLDDRAFAGAETSGAFPPGLEEQVELYVLETDLPDNALFAIWAGSNDLLNGSRTPSESIINIRDAMDTLAEFGAENILILNLADLGKIPDLIDSDESAAATAASQAFNSLLSNEIDSFISANPGIQVYEFDIYALYEAVRANPGGYGFQNVTDVAPNFFVDDEFDAEGYFFWDEIHPSTEAHELIAEEVFDVLNADENVDDDDDDDDSGSCFITTLLG